MRHLSALACLILLGACGSGQQPADNNRSEKATPADRVVPPIDHSGETRDVHPKAPPRPTSKPLVSRETSADTRTSAGKVMRYRAIGTEPFWAVTIQDSTAMLARPDHPPLRFAIVQESNDRAIRYRGDGFTLTATQGPCSDGMSDAIWSDRVQIAFGEGTLKGCGGVREDMREEPR